MLERLGRASARFRGLVVSIWALLALLGGVLGGAVFDRTQSVADAPPGSEAAVAQARLDRLDPEGESVVAVLTGTDFYDRGLMAEATALMGRLRELRGVADVTDAYTAGGPIGQDGRSSAVVVELDRGLDDEEAAAVADEVAALLRTLETAEVLVGGELLTERAFADRAVEDAAKGEGVALVALVGLLAVVLGGFRVGVLPVGTALAAIAAALLALTGLAGAVPVNEFAVNVVTLLGLGLCVDYSLLVLARFREQREDTPEATVDVLLGRTVATAGRAVLISGLAVTIALTGLFVLGDPLLSGTAVGGAIAVSLGTAAGITLVPALIALTHRHIPPPRTGRRTRRSGAALPAARRGGTGTRRPAAGTAKRRGGGTGRTTPPPAAGRAEGSGLLGGLARVAQRHALIVTLGVTALLLALAAPLASMVLGSSEVRSLPAHAEERRAHESLAANFPLYGETPLTVLIDAGSMDPAAARFREEVAELPGAKSVGPFRDLGPGVRAVDVTPHGYATGAEAQRLVQEVRTLAGATSGLLPAQVAGPAADLVDTRARVSDRLPMAVGVVVAATFALLLLLTGSVVLPLKALVLNGLTLAATLGTLVALFQWGWAADLLGFEAWGALDLATPLLLGMLVFGLTMDYEVFLLARIAEEWRARDPGMDPRAANDRAVLRGITASGAVVTTAAVAIGIVFLGFAVSDLVAMKEVGVGMAVAVLLDVTLLRGLLLPATMTLLGRWNWWAPGGRSPKDRVDGPAGEPEPSAGPRVIRSGGGTP
ncbi:MMPL family transporter [Streptomyces sp. NPDC007325]|uniref:MMPL family transporter n=1 Tax=Streptomyces sp. NPDC007325 TaxID=3154588 RepID=UPI0033E42C85